MGDGILIIISMTVSGINDRVSLEDCKTVGRCQQRVSEDQFVAQ